MPSKYLQLADTLRAVLEAGKTDRLFHLPTEMELSRTYGVSRQTVRQALSVLEKEGMIIKRRGSGSYPSPALLASAIHTAAVILPDDRAYLHSAVLRDLQTFFSSKNYSVHIFMTNNRYERECEILRQLLSEPVNLLLAKGFCTALPSPNERLYRRIMENGTPTAFWEGSPGFPDTLNLSMDYFRGGFQLTSYLIKQHQKIAGIFQIEEMESREKFRGCIQALTEHGLTPDNRNFFWYNAFSYPCTQTPLNEDSIPDDFLTWISRNCTAILCHNDMAAFALIQALLKRGISVPQDLSVVSFDNSYLSELSPVRITSMSCKNSSPWLTAAELLLQYQKEQLPLPKEKLTWHLNKKDSG